MARPLKKPVCHPDQPYFCKGLCKPCYFANWYKKNQERVKAARKDYVANNYEKARDCQKNSIAKNPEAPRQQAKTWKIKNPIKARNSRYKAYGWSVERYDAVFAEQGGMCDICKQPGEGNLYPDHKHTNPPVPRGLLCSSCNLAIGMLKDNPAVCRSAADYLEKYNALAIR